MIKLKLVSALSGNATVSLFDLATVLYQNPGTRVVGVVELGQVGNEVPAPGEDSDPTVKVQIKAVEIAKGEQAEHIRQAMAALHRHRTATGTLDEEMFPKLSDRAIEDLAGNLEAAETMRLRVVVEQWGEYIDTVMRGKLTATQLREELRTVRKGLAAGISWTSESIRS